jgi:UDP-N-acetylglucosamine--N-acetylmuramyl-(pentapeptide) pyrophosphoryl-undecaprenol N-acetylglucosamine transferase
VSTSPQSGGKLAVLAAGGTGGHLFPAQALAEVLRARGWRVVLATDERGALYADKFPAEQRVALDAATFKRGDIFGMIGALFAIAKGVGQAAAAFKQLRPAIVVGFGGYPSLPGLIAAITGKTPTLIHEQNAVLGRANRLLASHVSQVACAFPTLEKASRKVKEGAIVLGNPVRPDIRALYDSPYAPPEPGGEIRILITGGSQGARLLSELVPEAISKLPDELRFRLKVQQQTRLGRRRDRALLPRHGRAARSGASGDRPGGRLDLLRAGGGRTPLDPRAFGHCHGRPPALQRQAD